MRNYYSCFPLLLQMAGAAEPFGAGGKREARPAGAGYAAGSASA